MLKRNSYSQLLTNGKFCEKYLIDSRNLIKKKLLSYIFNSFFLIVFFNFLNTIFEKMRGFVSKNFLNTIFEKVRAFESIKKIVKKSPKIV